MIMYSMPLSLLVKGWPTVGQQLGPQECLSKAEEERKRNDRNKLLDQGLFSSGVAGGPVSGSLHGPAAAPTGNLPPFSPV